MRFSKFSHEIFAKRFSSSPQPLQQEIKYSLKEFLEAYEKCSNALKESLDMKLDLCRNDIKVCAFLYKPE
jgi:hypothetical protein